MSRFVLLPLAFLTAWLVVATAAGSGIASAPETDDDYATWVFFTDKRCSSSSSSHLSQRAIDRRIRNGWDPTRKPELDQDICEEYVQRVLRATGGGQVRVRSRWLNAVSFTFPLNNTPAGRSSSEDPDDALKRDLMQRMRRADESVDLSFIKSVQRVKRWKSDSDDTVSFSSSTSTPQQLERWDFYGYSNNQLAMLNVDKVHSLGVNGTGVIIGGLGCGIPANTSVFSQWQHS